jgi:serine protease Do
MTRLDRLVIFIFFIVAIIVGANLREPSDVPVARRPLPPPSATDPVQVPIKPRTPDRVRRPPVAPPSPDDPVLVVEDSGAPRNKVGTAFAVDSRGVWFTAKHVVDRCARLFIESTWGRIPARVAAAHPSADFAVLETSRGGPALAVVDQVPGLGEDGYALGFPAGRLGAEHARLMGRARMSSRGGINGMTPTLGWSEVSRVPESLDSLGGLSGGPMFDETGTVVGVLVAESARRGRVFTAAPELLRGALDDMPRTSRTPFAPVADRPEALSLNAQRAAQEQRIARVVCFAT